MIDIVSTDLRLILLTFVAIDIYAFVESVKNRCDLKTVLLVGKGIPYHGDPVMKGLCHLLPHFAGGLKYLSPGCLRLFLPEPIFLPCSASLLAEKSRHQGLVTSTLYSAIDSTQTKINLNYPLLAHH